MRNGLSAVTYQNAREISICRIKVRVPGKVVLSGPLTEAGCPGTCFAEILLRIENYLGGRRLREAEARAPDVNELQVA